MGGRVEHWRIPVRVGERLCDRAFSQPVHFVQDAARGLFVHLREWLGAKKVLPVQHLEQIELNVPEVALEVPHECSLLAVPPVLLASKLLDST